MKVHLISLYKMKKDILLSLKEFNKAFVENDKAIKLMEELPELSVIIEQKLDLYIHKAFYLLNENRIEEASQSMNQIIFLLKKAEEKDWLAHLSALMSVIIEKYEKENVLKLMELSNIGEELFPFVLAVQYLQTKEEVLIEKLSPEVRVVVEETIKTLQMISVENSEFEANQKKKPKKDRAGGKSKPLALSK